MLDPNQPLPSLAEACARRDQLQTILINEVPKLRDELNMLLGYIAAKQEAVESNGKVEDVVEVSSDDR